MAPAACDPVRSRVKLSNQLQAEADSSTWAGRKAPKGREIPARVLVPKLLPPFVVRAPEENSRRSRLYEPAEATPESPAGCGCALRPIPPRSRTNNVDPNPFTRCAHDSRAFCKIRNYYCEWVLRRYTVLHTTEGIRHHEDWAGLTTIGMCYSERTVQGETALELRYFIGSKKARAQYYGRGLRHHWGIENHVHWQLDVTFGEDGTRVRKRNAAENLALLRRLTLTLVQAHPAKLSIAKKRFAAALDPAFLEEILRGDGILAKP